jgi:hypothetical protein
MTTMSHEASYWCRRWELAECRALHFAELVRELERKFDPNQPRVPKGDPKGGQWTRLDGSGGRSKLDRDAERAARRFRSPPGGGARVTRRSEADAARTPTEEIVAPGGNPVGYRYGPAGQQIRTVTREEFLEIERQLRAGATRSSQPGYRGSEVWERADGMRFGVRRSERSGLTIDIFKTDGRPDPIVERIHQR